jgi:type VI secretion system protein
MAMALRLRIVSEHGQRLGQRATKVFGVHGGTIGRASENEWILPDPERYLSGKHARIEFRAGSYVLIDTSSNGTFVNGAQIPLGKYHEYVLRDGDYVRIGEYELLASIDASNDFPPDEDAIVAYDGGTPTAAVRHSVAGDIGADLDLSALLDSSRQLELEPEVEQESAAGAAAVPADDAAAWHMLTRPLKVGHTPPPRIPGTPLYDGDVEAGLAALCRGAGIDPRALPPAARAAALQLAGQLLRETVLGLMDLHQSRSDFRNQFRMPAASDAASDSVEDGADDARRGGPLSFTRSVDDNLQSLLATLSVRSGSVEALREVFRSLKSENTATLTALRVALEDLLTRFDPEQLSERFERGAKRGVFGTQNKSKYWDLYTDLYASLSQCPPEGFPHLFSEAFAKAYEAKLRTLIPPRRTVFGGETEPGYDPQVKVSGDR